MRKIIVRTVQRWHKGACRGCYSLGIAEGGKILHIILMSDPSLPLCVSDAGWVEMDLLLIYWAQNSRRCFQSSPYGGLRGQSRVTAGSRNGIKNVSTETGPGDNAELRWRWPQFRCRPTASKNFPAVQSLQKTKDKKTKTSACLRAQQGGVRGSWAKFRSQAMGINWSLCVLLQ